MKTGHRRLLKLADILKSVNRREFSMAVWYFEKTPECGSKACAVGWACSDPGFKRAGLKLLPSAWTDTAKVPAFHEHREWQAVAHFFDLFLPDAKELFMDDGVNKTPKQVARKIELFVKNEIREEAQRADQG